MLVKDNHPLLKKKIACFLENTTLFEPALRRARTCQIVRGRIETRQILVSGAVPGQWLDFPHVAQVFRLTRSIRHKRRGSEQTQTVYGITSLGPDQVSAQRLLSLVQGHWHIENRSHYVRDVTFAEDKSQVRAGSIPQVLAALRNACIALMRQAGFDNIARACRFHAAQPGRALALLGIPITE